MLKKKKKKQHVKIITSTSSLKPSTKRQSTPAIVINILHINIQNHCMLQKNQKLQMNHEFGVNDKDIQCVKLLILSHQH